MPVKLFELDAEIRAVESAMLDHAEANEGDVTDFPGLGNLIDLKDQREHKLLGLGCLLKERRAEAEAIKAEADKLVKRARFVANDCERLEGFIEGNLKPGEKLSDSRVTFSWRKSERVAITPETRPEDLAEPFRKVSVEFDRATIKEHLKAGKHVPGCALEPRLNLQVK